MRSVCAMDLVVVESQTNKAPASAEAYLACWDS